MSRAVRWGVAVCLSLAAFTLGWWVCAGFLHQDEGISLGIASVAVAIVMVIAGWWAGLEPTGKASDTDSESGTARANQHVRAGRDGYVSGRDLTINRFEKK